MAATKCMRKLAREREKERREEEGRESEEKYNAIFRSKAKTVSVLSLSLQLVPISAKLLN